MDLLFNGKLSAERFWQRLIWWVERGGWVVGDYASHQTVTTRNDFVLRRGAVKTMNVLFPGAKSQDNIHKQLGRRGELKQTQTD